MASEIRVNSITNRSGLGTVTFSDTGVVLSGVSTFSTGIVVAAGSASAPSISPSGDSNTGIFFPAADTIAFVEGGTEALRIDSNNRLGIGITNPQGGVHIVSNSNGGYLNLVISQSVTDTANRGGVIAGARKSNANSPFAAYSTWDDGSNRICYVGGGGWGLPEATQVSLYTATTYNETTGAALERLKIDSAGRMTLPYQPAFQAYSTTNASIPSGTNVLPFNATNFNIGSHYNTSTYRFTAPVAGRYLFSVNLNLYTAPGIMMPSVRINGSSVYHGNRLSANISGDNNLNMVVILSLSVNDYVESLSSAQGSSANLSNGATWTRFEGYLLG